MDCNVWLTADRMPLVRDIGWNQVNSIYTHPDRTLEYDVFLFVVKGCMQVVEENWEYKVREGEYVFLRHGYHHWGLQQSEAGTAWYWIHFNNMLDDLSNYTDRIPLLEQGIYHPQHFEYRIKLPKYGTSNLQPGLEHRLAKLVDDYHQTQMHNGTRTSLQVYELFLDLHAASVSKEDTPSVHAKSASLVGKVTAYLMDHAHMEFHAEQLSQHMGLNYNYISTTFRQQSGQTIIEVHTKLRILKAIDLMRHTSLNISEISEQLRYTSPYYFSRVFKKVMGEPPSSYWRHLYK